MTPPPAVLPDTLCASTLTAGARGLVAAVEGGEAVVERLASLGIVPGVTFRVVRGGTPMALAIGETRLALGRAWADALRVVLL